MFDKLKNFIFASPPPFDVTEDEAPDEYDPFSEHEDDVYDWTQDGDNSKVGNSE